MRLPSRDYKAERRTLDVAGKLIDRLYDTHLCIHEGNICIYVKRRKHVSEEEKSKSSRS